MLKDGKEVPKAARKPPVPIADPCPRLGTGHEPQHWQLLGQKDNGKWAWRCGNCLEVRTSTKEEGGPDPVTIGEQSKPSSIGRS